MSDPVRSLLDDASAAVVVPEGDVHGAVTGGRRRRMVVWAISSVAVVGIAVGAMTLFGSGTGGRFQPADLPVPPDSLRDQLPDHLDEWVKPGLVLAYENDGVFHVFFEGIVGHSCPVEAPKNHPDACISTGTHVMWGEPSQELRETGSHDLPIVQPPDGADVLWQGVPSEGSIGAASPGACDRIERFDNLYECRDGELVYTGNDDVYGVGEEARDGDLTFVVGSVECNEGEEEQLCIFHLDITNDGEEETGPLDPSWQILRFEDGRALSPDQHRMRAYGDDFFTNRTPFNLPVPPSESMPAALIYLEIPHGELPSALELHASEGSNGVVIQLDACDFPVSHGCFTPSPDPHPSCVGDGCVAAKRYPVPVSPADRSFEGGRCVKSSGAVCVYPSTLPDSTELSGRVFGHREPLEGARVSLNLETMKEPLIAITDQWGQFAFTNVPLRPGGKNTVTCGTQKVEADGFGRYAQGIDTWYDEDGGYSQTIELFKEPQVEWWGNAYDPPQRCVDWSEKHGFR